MLDRFFALKLVDIHTLTSIKILLAFVHEVDAECDINVPSTELRLPFVKSCELMRGCTPTIRDVYLDRDS